MRTRAVEVAVVEVEAEVEVEAVEGERRGSSLPSVLPAAAAVEVLILA